MRRSNRSCSTGTPRQPLGVCIGPDRDLGASGTVRETVSACLIVQDEEERLQACLESVAFCDEIVVVDGGSRDRTVEIARASGARVIENPWPGFGAQRNVALDNASCQWVLEVDADERVSLELRHSIEAFLADPPVGAEVATISVRQWFLGRPLGPAAKEPNYRERLFRRGAYRHDESRTVYEGIWTEGGVHPLVGDLEHALADTWSEALRDTLLYSRLEAAQTARPGRASAYALGIIVRPLGKLAYRLLLGGWRDGWRGAARITLESLSDALVWTFVLLGAGAPGGGGAARGHFGRRRRPVGAVRLVAVAFGPSDAGRAARWLRLARESGAEVALVTDAPLEAAPDLHVRPLQSRSPLELVRALDAEEQLRKIDALVASGWRAGWLLRLVPRHLRGIARPLDIAADPAGAARTVRAQR
jgi:hypothetical protein